MRSRSRPLLTARRTAKVHERCDPGYDVAPASADGPGSARGPPRPRCARGCARTRAGGGRSGRPPRGSRVDPRASLTRLIVIMRAGASPVNRLETETPSSASSPRPLLARSSMTAASAGRFATRTRPSSRSYHRNAGTPRAVPCRMPCWLAGVVHGSCTVHSCERGGRLDPAPQVRQVAGPERPLGDGEGDPVQLDEHDPVHLRVRDLRRARVEQRGHERLVGAGAQHPGQQGPERGSDPGRRDHGPERVEVHARQQSRASPITIAWPTMAQRHAPATRWPWPP